MLRLKIILSSMILSKNAQVTYCCYGYLLEKTEFLLVSIFSNFYGNWNCNENPVEKYNYPIVKIRSPTFWLPVPL